MAANHVSGVATYEKSLSLSGVKTPKTQFSTGPIQEQKAIGSFLQEKAQKIDDRIYRNAMAEAENTLSSEMARMEREYANKPDAMREAITEYRDKFFEDITDPDIADKLGMQYDRSALLAVERAKDGHQRIVDDQAKFYTLQSIDQAERELIGVSGDVFSKNPTVAAAATSKLQEVMGRIKSAAFQVNSQGEPIFSAEARFQRIGAIQDAGFGGAALEYIRQAADKEAAIQAIEKGELTIDLPDGKGGVEKINVKDALSSRALSSLRSEAKRQQDEQKKALIEAQEADIQTQIKNQAGLMEIIQSDGLSTDEKVLKLNEMDLKGEIREDFAAEARRYLSSAEKINAATDNQVIADIVTRMYDLNSIAGMNDKDYLIGVQNLKKDIMTQRANGRLSGDDEVKLNNQIKTLMSAKVSEATQKVAYQFSDARALIDQSLPPEERGDAIRKLFYETIDLQKKAEDPENKGKDAEIQAMYKERAQAIISDNVKSRRENAVKRAEELHKAVKAGEPAPMPSFNTVQEAEAAKLPKGTIILINGKRARVD